VQAIQLSPGVPRNKKRQQSTIAEERAKITINCLLCRRKEKRKQKQQLTRVVQ